MKNHDQTSATSFLFFNEHGHGTVTRTVVSSRHYAVKDKSTLRVETELGSLEVEWFGFSGFGECSRTVRGKIDCDYGIRTMAYRALDLLRLLVEPGRSDDRDALIRAMRQWPPGARTRVSR